MTSRMKVSFILALALMQAAMMSAGAQDSKEPVTTAGSASVQDLGFKYDSGKSKLEINFDKNVSFEKELSDGGKQVIIYIKNAKIGKKWARRLDTSQYKTNVSLVSPYQSEDSVRVVLQMKEPGDVQVSQDGNKLVALIDNKAGPAAEPKEEIAQDSEAPASPTAATATEAESATPAGATTTSITAGGESSNSESLDSFFQAQKAKVYSGKRIYLQVKDTELSDVFRIISEASEFNIILADNVKGKLMMNLTDVPWDQALDLILQTQHLAAERHGNVLRVTTLEALTREKEAEAAALAASTAAEPLVVKIFPISYAKISELKTIIADFMTKDARLNTGVQGFGAVQAPATGATTPVNLRGSIQVDSRTNSLVVRDTPSSIEKIKRIIKELDTPTPQILIEAKFVEVNELYNKQVQGRIFSTSRELDSTGALAFNSGKNAFGSFFGSGFPAALPTSFAISPVEGGATFGFAPKTGLIPGLSEIGAFVSILENESKAKVIASPRVVAQNKETAEISQGKMIQIPVPAGANVSGGFQTINAILKLLVTPQVTNEGSITIKLTFSQEAPGTTPPGASFATDSKKVDTQVLVDSGATLVIGGIYTSNVTDGESGIPILRNLPLIGALFGAKTKAESKGELFIFLTPRIINDKEATGFRG